MPPIFKQGNSELLVLAKSPTTENLQAYFDARTDEWCESMICMECFTVGVFYDLTTEFERSSAFDLLNVASQMITDSMDDQKFLRYVDLLSNLAGSSDTTEIPSNLTRKWKAIVDRATKIEPDSIGLETLRRHYRDFD